MRREELLFEGVTKFHGADDRLCLVNMGESLRSPQSLLKSSACVRDKGETFAIAKPQEREA